MPPSTSSPTNKTSRLQP